MPLNEKKRLNIAFLGDERAGKTSFIKRPRFDEFDEEYFPTKAIYTESSENKSDNSVYTATRFIQNYMNLVAVILYNSLKLFI